MRHRAVRMSIERTVDTEESADVLAAFGSSMLVGYQHLAADDPQLELEALLDHYLKIAYSHSDNAILRRG
jgi:hypothetical protein